MKQFARNHEQSSFHFGVFELDPHSGELRKHGIKLKLQHQPLQILTILLERPGEIVTREEIQKRLWPDNTYVDFENAINSAMRKLRDALGDTAENPQFIETLSRRGYRFIYPLSGAMRPLPVGLPKPSRKQHRIAWAALPVSAVLAIGLSFWIANSRNQVTDAPAPLVPLTSYPGFQLFPSFSPEGARVAFSWAEPGRRPSNIYVKMIGPGDPVRLTADPNGDFAPVWSPDGRFIAFLRERDPFHASVMVIPALGGNERELTRITFQIMGAPPSPFLAWSPDGRWLLAIDGDAPGLFERYRILRISAESGEKRALTVPPRITSGDGGLAISPDGKTLAFARTDAGDVADIYVVPLSKDLFPLAEPQRITFDKADIDGLSWTADGRRLVFSSTRGGRRELWRVLAKPGSRPVKLTAAGDDPFDVAVSIGAPRLVYSHKFGYHNIWRVSLKGKDVGQSADVLPATRNETHATYSPDGKRIAFEADFSGNEEIWLANSDGSNPAQVTSFGNAWAGSPQWSPDGQKIAFDCNTGANWDIYLIDSQGGTPVRLTTNPANDFKPSWSRDGKWIYFGSNRTGMYQIWKMPATGGKKIQITKNGGFAGGESVDGKTVYYTGGPGIWSVPVSGGEPTRVVDCSNAPFAVSKGGLYFVDPTRQRLKFLDFTRKTIVNIAALGDRPPTGISISPDEASLLYTKNIYAASQLMLVENFR